MHDTYVTVVGNVVSDPSLRVTGGGVPVLNLRVASTPRHFDGASGEWRDRETTYLTVSCWRALAEHVSRSVHRGDPVVVHGRLVQKSYETNQGERRTTTEVEAATVGHDLTRGAAAFARAGRATRSGPGGVSTGAPAQRSAAASEHAGAPGGEPGYGTESAYGSAYGSDVHAPAVESDPWSAPTATPEPLPAGAAADA